MGERMAHRALIYSVRIHRKWKPNDFIEFGDLEDKGVYLGDVLHEIFSNDFLATRDNKIVVGESAKLVGVDLQTSFRSGDGGYGADIEDENHNLLLRQLPELDSWLTRRRAYARVSRYSEPSR